MTGVGGPTRRSIEVEGLAHGSLPIPVGSRVGHLIATSGIRGVDPATGELPASVAEQARLMFDNLRRVVEAAGGTAETILKVTVFAADRAHRTAVDPEWLRLFPDASSRPARHLQVTALPGGMALQCEALAVAEEETNDG